MQNPALKQAVIPRDHLSYAEHKSRSQQEELTRCRQYTNLQLEEWGGGLRKGEGGKRCTHKKTYERDLTRFKKSKCESSNSALSCDTQVKTSLWSPISYSHAER